jgi:steroid delta-isomerase-like uncharacterized protein
MDAERFLNDLIEAWNSHDQSRVMALYHPEFEGDDLSESKQAKGFYEAGRMVQYIFNAFPDLSMTPLDWGCDGDKFFYFWKATGHHRGKLMNIPPTGKHCSFMGASFLVLRDGKIVRGRRMWDVATMLRQIGLLPEPTTADYS